MASAFKIIKNAPGPRTAARTNYPFAEMEVGDAFDVPAAMHLRLNSAASYFGSRNGRKYSIRKMDEATVRCWRVA